LAITNTKSNLGWQIARGPMQVVFGVVLGLGLGVVLGCTKIWNTQNKRMLSTYFMW